MFFPSLEVRISQFRLSFVLAAVSTSIIAAGLLAGMNAQEKSDTRIYGQQLVDEVATKHKPEVIYLGLHAQTPTSAKMVIFAGTDPSKIGKESSCGDLDVVTKGVPIMEMKGKSTTVLERLLDSSGQTVGLLVVGLSFTEGQEMQAAKLARELSDEIAHKIPSKSALFETAK